MQGGVTVRVSQGQVSPAHHQGLHNAGVALHQSHVKSCLFGLCQGVDIAAHLVVCVCVCTCVCVSVCVRTCVRVLVTLMSRQIMS